MMYFFTSMRRVIETLHLSAALLAPRSHFRAQCGPTSQKHFRTRQSVPDLWNDALMVDTFSQAVSEGHLKFSNVGKTRDTRRDAK